MGGAILTEIRATAPDHYWSLRTDSLWAPETPMSRSPCSAVTAPWEELAAVKAWRGTDWECSREAGLLNMIDCFHCAANPPACREMA